MLRFNPSGRKRFPQLLDYPRARRLPGHVEVKNTPAFVRLG
jgi:hypothetical protein